MTESIDIDINDLSDDDFDKYVVAQDPIWSKTMSANVTDCYVAYCVRKDGNIFIAGVCEEETMARVLVESTAKEEDICCSYYITTRFIGKMTEEKD